MQMFRYIKTKVGIPREYIEEAIFEYKENKLRIYNYIKINDLSKELIDLTLYSIKGTELCIDELTKFHILISGKIESIELKHVQDKD